MDGAMEEKARQGGPRAKLMITNLVERSKYACGGQ